MAILLAFSLAGGIAVLYAVPMNVGGLSDSVAYIGAARNLAGGTGFYLAHFLPPERFTHWAPLYPIILATPAYVGVDPIDSAKWIDALTLACTIFLSGFIAWAYCGRSALLGFLAALSILFSRDMIEIHCQALSEPLFVVFVLAGIAPLLSYVESGNTKSLLWTAIAMAAAFLTRYSGAAFLIAAFVVAFIIPFSWRRLNQLTSSAITFGLIAVLPVGAWIIHNILVAAQFAGDRKFVVHSIGRQKFRDLFSTVTLWFCPEAVPNRLRLLLLAGLITLVFAAVVSASRRSRQSQDPGLRSTLLLAQTCLVFDVVYLLFLIMNISFLDADIPLDMRLLSPIYPVTALLLISSLALRRRMFGVRSILCIILFAACLSIISLNAMRFLGTARDIRANGVGFQTAYWRDDQVMKYVRDLPGSIMLYSDAPARIYFATRRPPYLLPEKFDLVTTLANREYENQMNNLAKLATQRSIIVIIFFASNWVNGPFPQPPELTERRGFHSLFRSAKGTYILSGSSEASDR